MIKRKANQLENSLNISYISYRIKQQAVGFALLQHEHLPLVQRVNIFASGPSIEQVAFDDKMCQQPCLFVNGSISLLSQHDFQHVVGYVISDARFVEHALNVIHNNYAGQPWFITLPVLQALIKVAPELMQAHHHAIRIIHAVDRPIIWRTSLWQKLCHPLTAQPLPLLAKRRLALMPDEGDDTVISLKPDSEPVIGVSLDATQGFVEAGTVAYVAAQLAFAMQAEHIHLFGIDLVNSQQPRFYENKANKAPCKLDKAVENRIIPAFDWLAVEYAKRGCHVFNHSPVSASLFHHVPCSQD